MCVQVLTRGLEYGLRPARRMPGGGKFAGLLTQVTKNRQTAGFGELPAARGGIGAMEYH
jgi:hypothetical protein